MKPSFVSAVLARLRSLPANEPIVLGQTVGAALTLGVTFGLHLSPPQIAGVVTVVTGFTTIILRAACTPANPTTSPRS